MSNGLQQYRRSCKQATVLVMCFCLVFLLVSCAGGPRPSAHVSDTRLHDAARDGHKIIVLQFIETGADVNARAKGKREGWESVTWPPLTGITPLHNAAQKGHRDVAELLIAKGAKVNARDSDPNTPLHYAAQRGQRDVVALLIAKGADVNARENKWGYVPLQDAVEAGHKEVVEMLIVHGADVNAQNRDSSFFNVNAETSLHIAARKGHREVADLLIAKGADVNARDKWGKTPLDYALKEHSDGVTELLRSHGAGKEK